MKLLLSILTLLLFLGCNKRIEIKGTSKAVIQSLKNNGKIPKADKQFILTTFEDQTYSHCELTTYVKKGVKYIEINKYTPLKELKLSNNKISIQGGFGSLTKYYFENNLWVMFEATNYH